MLATLDELQRVLGTEGFFLIKVDELAVTFAREDEIVFCHGAFYVGHQMVVHVEQFLGYIAKFWDEDLASRLDAKFQRLDEFGLEA
ncbi:MAG: hypothetical protein IIC96_19420 [Chloroflexi bacterium]|nr:hypothetical protein [Chloroflexota bacterium]